MRTITKKDLINEIHDDENINRQVVRSVLKSFFSCVVAHTVKGKRIEIRDFGVFLPVIRKQKIGRNPKKAKDPIIIPERYALKFAPAQNVKKLFENKEIVNDL